MITHRCVGGTGFPPFAVAVALALAAANTAGLGCDRGAGDGGTDGGFDAGSDSGGLLCTCEEALVDVSSVPPWYPDKIVEDAAAYDAARAALDALLAGQHTSPDEGYVYPITHTVRFCFTIEPMPLPPGVDLEDRARAFIDEYAALLGSTCLDLAQVGWNWTPPTGPPYDAVLAGYAQDYCGLYMNDWAHEYDGGLGLTIRPDGTLRYVWSRLVPLRRIPSQCLLSPVDLREGINGEVLDHEGMCPFEIAVDTDVSFLDEQMIAMRVGSTLEYRRVWRASVYQWLEECEIEGMWEILVDCLTGEMVKVRDFQI